MFMSSKNTHLPPWNISWWNLAHFSWNPALNCDYWLHINLLLCWLHSWLCCCIYIKHLRQLSTITRRSYVLTLGIFPLHVLVWHNIAAPRMHIRLSKQAIFREGPKGPLYAIQLTILSDFTRPHSWLWKEASLIILQYTSLHQGCQEIVAEKGHNLSWNRPILDFIK